MRVVFGLAGPQFSPDIRAQLQILACMCAHHVKIGSHIYMSHIFPSAHRAISLSMQHVCFLSSHLCSQQHQWFKDILKPKSLERVRFDVGEEFCVMLDQLCSSG